MVFLFPLLLPHCFLHAATVTPCQIASLPCSGRFHSSILLKVKVKVLSTQFFLLPLLSSPSTLPCSLCPNHTAHCFSNPLHHSCHRAFAPPTLFSWNFLPPDKCVPHSPPPLAFCSNVTWLIPWLPYEEFRPFPKETYDPFPAVFFVKALTAFQYSMLVTSLVSASAFEDELQEDGDCMSCSLLYSQRREQCLIQTGGQ